MFLASTLELLDGEHKAWLAEGEVKGLTGPALGNAQEAKPVISTAMANPETIFSERDIFMRFLRSAHGACKGKTGGGGRAARARSA
ncbi:MAG: hypothetical protein JO172_07570 [Hyphomicrobiales bacterium]|nr:hypothetical protein [Hyphomicrobiales bacterium]